jgi:hypothetical protein
MAKKEELEIEFEEEGAVNASEQEMEFINEEDVESNPDEALPEEVKKKSKTDLYNELVAKRDERTPDAAAVMNNTLEALAAKLKAPEALPLPVAPGESEDDFINRLKTDLFDENKVGKTLQEAVMRYAGPMLSQQNEQNFQQAEKLMRLDPETGPIFKEYNQEIKEYIKKNFPPAYHKTPQALDLAYKQVYASHVQEIAQKMAQRQVEEEIAKLKKEAPAVKQREPFRMEGSSNAAPQGPRKMQVVITQGDRQEAEERGVDASVVAAQRARRVSKG